MAAMDAAVWPALWIGIALAAPLPSGVLRLMVVACALVSAPGRLHRAIVHNERYRFTTWRWGRAIVVLVLVGMLMKLALVLAGF